jgi:hypothetical protein
LFQQNSAFRIHFGEFDARALAKHNVSHRCLGLKDASRGLALTSGSEQT